MGRSDPRTMGPEADKRLRSGFWRREHDFESDTITWTCDKRKLIDKVAGAMLNQNFAREFARQGTAVLDCAFGEGTAKAYSYKTSGNDRVQMRFNAERGFDLAKGRDEMTLWFDGSGIISNDTACTTANNTFTSASTNTLTINSGALGGAHRQEMRQQQSNHVNKIANIYHHKPKKQVTKVPFKGEYGESILVSLQREFDRWAKPQMKLVACG